MTDQQISSEIRTMVAQLFDSIKTNDPDGMDHKYYAEAFSDELKSLLGKLSLDEYYRALANVIIEIIASKEMLRLRARITDAELIDLFTAALSEWQQEVLHRVRVRVRQLRYLRAEGIGLEQAMLRAKSTDLSVLKRWKGTFEGLKLLLNNYRQWNRYQVELSQVFPQVEGEIPVSITPEEFDSCLSISPSTIHPVEREKEGSGTPAGIHFNIHPIEANGSTTPSGDDLQSDDAVDTVYIMMRMRRIDAKDMLGDIRASMILRALRHYGNDGQIIMRFLLNDSKAGEADCRVDAGGRPRELFTTKVVLWLDRYLIPRKYIGMFLRTLQGDDDIDPIAEGKRVSQRIRTNGGNTLRFIADQFIRNFDLCTDCVWAWNSTGILTRVLSCDKHVQSIEEEPIHFSMREGKLRPLTNDWLNEMLGLRTEGDFANALEWHLKTAIKPSPK